MEHEQKGERTERPIDRPPHARLGTTHAQTATLVSHHRPRKSLAKVGMSQTLGYMSPAHFAQVN